MPTALITRPEQDAAQVAGELAGRGFVPLIAPLLDIVPVPHPPVTATGAQGVLVTSANGIRSLAALMSDRHLPVWSVGDASARVSRSLGFQTVTSAGGDVESLAALVRQQCDPAAGWFLHAAGSVTAGDLGGQLDAAGFQLRRLVLYESRTAQSLPPVIAQALQRKGVDVALFYSPRTAATFARLVQLAGMGDALSCVMAYCLSSAVAAELSALPWAAIRVAPHPTQAALLGLLDDDRGKSDE